MEVRSLEAIARALNQANVRYLVVVGLAVIAHGFLRATRDVDIVIQLERENVVAGLNALLNIEYQMAIPVSTEQFSNAELRETWRKEINMR